MRQSKLNFEQWIKKCVDYYSPIIGVDLHEITIKKQEDEKYLMSIKCTYPYLDPTLYYSKESEELWKKGELKKDIILHELCHIITDKLYCKAISRFVSRDEIEDERENLTDTISAIIRKLDK